MRRTISIVMTLLIIFSLAGCSKEESSQNNGNTTIGGDIDGNRAEEILGIKKDKEDTQQNEIKTDENGNATLDSLIGNNTNSDNQAEQNENIQNQEKDDKQDKSNTNQSKGETVSSNQLLSNIWEFRAIDCGQADSILLHSVNSNVLVDAGEEKNAVAIRKVLDNLGIKKIDLLIGTHAHADHIGGMQAIVENYDIGEIVMSPQTHTSKTYENLLMVIDEKGYEINIATPGDTYEVGDLDIEIIGPCDEYDNDLNNSSVVAIASYGDTDILLTGDAELQSEKDYVQYLADKDIEILKVGHHGSDTSTSDNLLSILQPEIALISCGTGNKYGHPKEETINKLVKNNITVYRTDLLGDIIVRTNGTEYTVEDSDGNDISPSNTGNGETANNNTENSNSDAQVSENNQESNNNQVNNNNSDNSNIVYASRKGHKYHSRDTCIGLYTAREIRELTESEAIADGMTKCNKCWE